MCLILLTCSSLNVFANGTYDRNVDNICKVEKLKETISKEELRNILLNTDVPEELHLQAEEKYNKIIQEELKTQIESARVGTQIKNYSSKVVSSYRDRKGKFHKRIPQGFSKSETVAVSLGAGTSISGTSDGTISLSAGVSKAVTYTVYGPSYNTKVPGSNLNATHGIVIGILRGSVSHVTYDLHDGSTGAFIKHVDQYVINDAQVVVYTLLASDSSSGYRVGHCSENKNKVFSSEAAYKSVLESSNVKNAYAW